MDCKFKNNAGKFCYICANLVLPNRTAKITHFMNKAFTDYFRIKQGDKDKESPPTFSSKMCEELE